MAIAKTINGLLQGPDGKPRAGQVTITLSQFCTIPGTSEVVGEPIVVNVDASGIYSFLHYGHNDLTPTGTYSTVRESTLGGLGAAAPYTIVVPITGQKTITGAVNNGSGLIRITATAHGYASGNKVDIQGVVGTVEANKVGWTITVIDVNTFDLQGSAFANAYVSGGTANLQYVMTSIMTNPPTLGASPSRVSTLTVDGAATFTAGPVVIGADPLGGQLLRVGGTSHFGGAATFDASLIIGTDPGGGQLLRVGGTSHFGGTATFDGAVVYLAGATFSAGVVNWTNVQLNVYGTFNFYNNQSGLSFSTLATGYIIGGSIGTSLRDKTNTFDNLLVGDAGAVTIRNGLTVSAGGARITGDPGGLAGAMGVTNVTGLGNGAQTAVTAPLVGTGSGPATPTAVAQWLKVYDGATTRWIPMMV